MKKEEARRRRSNDETVASESIRGQQKSDAAASEEEWSQGQDESLSAHFGAKICSVCRDSKPRAAYSKTQWAARGNVRKRVECVTAAGGR